MGFNFNELAKRAKATIEEAKPFVELAKATAATAIADAREDLSVLKEEVITEAAALREELEQRTGAKAPEQPVVEETPAAAPKKPTKKPAKKAARKPAAPKK